MFFAAARALGRCRCLLLRTVLLKVLVASRHSARGPGRESANLQNVPLDHVPLAGSLSLKGRQAGVYKYQSGSLVHFFPGDREEIGAICHRSLFSSLRRASRGKPRFGVFIGGGNIDSMVAHYTAAKKRRSSDAYSPGNKISRVARSPMP